MKIMVAYDGTLQAKEALAYGIEKAREKGGEVVALHVFNSGMFMDYDATPGARDAARSEAAKFVAEAKAIIQEKGKGVTASLFTGEGSPEDAVIEFAKAEKVDVLLCPPKYQRIVNRYRETIGLSSLAGEAAKMNLTAVTVASKN